MTDIHSIASNGPIGFIDAVRAALERMHHGAASGEVGAATSVVDDLGLDSVRLLEFACALEDELGLADVDLQEWLDAEGTREGKRFTLGSLGVFLARRSRAA
jgi:hypothetical protein